MRFNKTYLKLGVAFTAAFGFGFLVGRVYQARKFQNLMNEMQDKMRSFKEEIETSPEPEQETTLEEIIQREDEDMKKRRKQTLEEIQELAKTEAGKKAVERIEKFPATREASELGMWTDFTNDILKYNAPEDLFVEDITPWGCSQQHPIICMVFAKKEGQFFWNDYSQINGEFSGWEINLIILAFFCFSTYRQDEDGTRYHYSSTPIQNLLAAAPLLRHEEHVYTRNSRILYFPELEKEVHIQMIETAERQDDIRLNLADIINYNGGYDPYLEEVQ